MEFGVKHELKMLKEVHPDYVRGWSKWESFSEQLDEEVVGQKLKKKKTEKKKTTSKAMSVAAGGQLWADYDLAGRGLEGALSKWWVMVYGSALTSADLQQSQTNNQTLREIEKETFWEFWCSHYSRRTGLNRTGITRVAENYQVEGHLCTAYTAEFSFWMCAFLQNLYTINDRPRRPGSACIITCWLHANTSTLRVSVNSFFFWINEIFSLKHPWI